MPPVKLVEKHLLEEEDYWDPGDVPQEEKTQLQIIREELLAFNGTVTSDMACFSAGICYNYTMEYRFGNEDIVKYLNGIIMPIITTITIISNCSVMTVLTRKSMRTPTNMVLFFLALCDFLTIIGPGPILTFFYSTGIYRTFNFTATSCRAIDFFYDIWPQAWHSCSNLLTLTLAIMRTVYLTDPPAARKWCTIEIVYRIFAIILVIGLGHEIPRIFEMQYSTYTIDVVLDSGEMGTRDICFAYPSDWVMRLNPHYYIIVFHWFRIVSIQLGPCASIVFLNNKLYIAMRAAEDRRRRLTHRPAAAANRGGNGPSAPPPGNVGPVVKSKKRHRDAQRTTMMLMIVMSFFLVTEIPLAVMVFLHTISSSFGFSFMDYEIAGNVVVFVNTGIMCSFPINFIIYCGMSRQFRSTFKEVIIDNLLLCLKKIYITKIFEWIKLKLGCKPPQPAAANAANEPQDGNMTASTKVSRMNPKSTAAAPPGIELPLQTALVEGCPQGALSICKVDLCNPPHPPDGGCPSANPADPFLNPVPSTSKGGGGGGGQTGDNSSTRAITVAHVEPISQLYDEPYEWPLYEEDDDEDEPVPGATNLHALVVKLPREPPSPCAKTIQLAAAISTTDSEGLLTTML